MYRNKSVVFKDTFWLFVLGSAGLHAALWFGLPNPIKQTSSPQKIEVMSTIPVVTLPTRSTTIAKATRSQSSESDAATLKSFKIPKSPDRLPQKIVKDSTKNSTVADKSKSASSQDKKPVKNAAPVISSAVSKVDKPERLNPKGNDINNSDSPDTQKKLDPATPNQDAIANNGDGDDKTPGNDKTLVNDKVLNDRTVADIFNKYRNNIALRKIAPPSATVSASQVEPDVSWISPQVDGAISAKGTVSIALLVTPEGKVEKQLMKPSGIDELDKIASQTVEGYYDKFKPAKDGKYRYVVIEFKFPIPS
jgi:hypothetical protein